MSDDLDARIMQTILQAEPGLREKTPEPVALARALGATAKVLMALLGFTRASQGDAAYRKAIKSLRDSGLH